MFDIKTLSTKQQKTIQNSQRNVFEKSFLTVFFKKRKVKFQSDTNV